MKINQIKLFVAAIAFVSMFALVAFNTTSAGTFANDYNTIPVQDDVAAAYKKQCAMCHTAKADKFFNPSKSMESHIEAIMKGRPDSKPPMPAFGAKGIDDAKAKALVEYMIQLRGGSTTNTSENTNTSNTNLDASSNTNSNTSENTSNSSSNTSNTSDTNSNTSTDTNKSAFTDEQIAASYKSKCAMCHTAAADKFFNPGKSDEELTTAVLKGRPDSKPPMPGYEAKGMKADEALALVNHMRGLKAAKKTE